ncbi:MAG: methionine adenosyltransferase [Deltaproteobacteria bacterium]|nr:methionine adenosyltransferase [Deltaproteobacteria bacterium]
MSMTDFLFTSESVTEGHPDKVADQISDAILDAIIAQDPRARVACETMVTTGMAIIAGEISTSCYVNMPTIVRETIKEIGYNDSAMGFDWETCAVLTSIDEQSPDITIGVEESKDHEQGAGDQGLMFGYACNETPELMPMPIIYAHRLTRRLAEVRKKKILDFLRPDGKSQVTIQYVNNKPTRMDSVVIAAQHSDKVTNETLKEGILEEVIFKIIPPELRDKNTKYYINTTGRFVHGGPKADCGLTGRKIIVDTYGGVGSHGGGCFSGKDPSKMDRGASYMARHVAKNIVAAGMAEKCEVQIAYTIGKANPVSFMIDTSGTFKIPPDEIARIAMKHFDLRPKAIIQYLDLLKPIYKQTACYGHFGRNEPGFTWERINKAEELRKAAGL